jgi:hypothetical protein
VLKTHKPLLAGVGWRVMVLPVTSMNPSKKAKVTR